MREVQRFVDEAFNLIATVFTFVWRWATYAWNETVGVIVRMWNLPYDSLSMAQIILYWVVILAAIGLLIYFLWVAVEIIKDIAQIFVDVVRIIANNALIIIPLAIIAFGGARVLLNYQF